MTLVSGNRKLAGAVRADDHMGRLKIASLIEQDQARREVQPRLPDISFARRRLADEDKWGRQRIEMKVIE